MEGHQATLGRRLVARYQGSSYQVEVGGEIEGVRGVSGVRLHHKDVRPVSGFTSRVPLLSGISLP